jgi:hypothetical protein
LIASFLFVNVVYADEEIDNLVFATFNIDFVSGTEIEIEVNMQVEKITTDFTYTADEIKIAGEQEIGAFRLLLFQMLKDQINDMFPNAELENFRQPPNEKDTNIFNSNFTVNLNSLYFGLNDSVNANDFINGVIDMGAIVNYSLGLSAEDGWNNTYYVSFKNDLTYKKTSGVLTGDRHRWRVNNWDAIQPSSFAEIELRKIVDERFEEIYLEYILDSEDADNPSLQANILSSYISISKYDVIPDFIYNLEVLPADGVRLFVENNLFTWNDTYQNTIKPIQEKIKTNIENSEFNQNLDFSFSWDSLTTENCKEPYNISNMNAIPAVKGSLIDSDIILKIHGIKSKALFGLVNAGAETNITQDALNFGEGLGTIGYNYNISLILPIEMYIGTDNIYTWNETIIPEGDFNSNNVRLFPEQDINSEILIDMGSTDLNLASFLTGSTELMFGIDMSEHRNYNITQIPNEFSIPNEIKIDNLCSDAFRVCVQEEVFSSEEIDSFLKGEKIIFESRMRNLLTELDISGNIQRQTFDDSISSWDEDITNMDSETPIEVRSYAHSTYPVSFDLGLFPPTFEIPSRTFNFKGLQYQDVTYKIVFPHGIDADITYDSHDKAETKHTEDGREYIIVNFNSSEFNLTDEVSVNLVPSALFIIGTFMPCMIALIITLIFIIAILIIRRKKKGKIFKFRRKSEPEEEIIDYEDEDYYVPPPPGSK